MQTWIQYTGWIQYTHGYGIQALIQNVDIYKGHRLGNNLILTVLLPLEPNQSYP